MAIAPTAFGNFGNDLLVGNFGDGTINAFDPSTGKFLGQLDGADGKPIINLGLWDLTVGNGANGGSKSNLYFTAEIPGDGTGGRSRFVRGHRADAGAKTFALLGSGLLALIGTVRRRKNAAIA